MPVKSMRLMKNYMCDYTYILKLKLNAVQEVYFKQYVKGSVEAFNRTLQLQMNCFDQGFTSSLPASAIKRDAGRWHWTPGSGYLESIPLNIIHQSIENCCLKCEDAFRSKQRYQFPQPITSGYKHLEFQRKVVFNQSAKTIHLPGVAYDIGFSVLQVDPTTLTSFLGKLKKLWIIRHKEQWLAIAWTREKRMVGSRAMPAMIRASRLRLNKLLEYTYDDNHWIVKMHEDLEISRERR